MIDDPNARFVVQTSGSSFQITGTNSTFTSSPVGQYLDTVGTTASYPFVITDMVIDPPGANGTDATSNYNYVVVGFNNEWLRSNTAVTGIS